MDLKNSDILLKLQLLETFESSIKFDDIKNYVKFFNEHFSDLNQVDKNKLTNVENNLLSALEIYSTHISDIKNQLSKDILSYNETYKNLSNKMWETNVEKFTFSEHQNWANIWNPKEDDLDRFINASSIHAGWHFPGAIVGAKDTKLINTFDFASPFYSIEQYDEYLDLQKAKFNETASRRIMWYNLNNIDSLPYEGLGLISIYNEIPFLPFSISSVILEIFATKLYPSGILLFNYNDCSTVRGLEYFENESQVFTTPAMFDELLIPLGFTQIEKYNSNTEPFSYLVYRKNGNRNHIKKAYPAGIIKKQPTLKTPDHSERLEYIRKLVQERNS